MKTGEHQRVNARVHQLHGLFIKTVPHIHGKDLRRLDGQRTVQIHLKIPVFRQEILLFDLTDEIKHLLGPAHGKGWNDHIAAPVKGLFDDPCKLTDIIRLLRRVDPVAVGGLHHHIIRCRRIARILNDRLVDISHISGKYQLLRHIPLGRPHFDAGRAEQMSHVREADINPLADADPLPVLTGHQQTDGIQGVLHHVHRLILRFPCTPALPVAPLRLKLLDVRAVAEHDIAQIRGGKCGKDLSFESFFRKSGEHAGMINMGMGQKYVIHFRGRDRKPRVLIEIRPLLHAAVDQDILSSRLKEMTAARHFMGCSYKCQFHNVTCLFCIRPVLIVSYGLPLFHLFFIKDHAFFQDLRFSVFNAHHRHRTVGRHFILPEMFHGQVPFDPV